MRICLVILLVHRLGFTFSQVSLTFFLAKWMVKTSYQGNMEHLIRRVIWVFFSWGHSLFLFLFFFPKHVGLLFTWCLNAWPSKFCCVQTEYFVLTFA